MSTETETVIPEGRTCVEHLEQCVYTLDMGIDYSRQLDGHNGLQEIARLVKLCIQQQIKECRYCERNQRDTAGPERPAADSIFLDIPRELKKAFST